MLGWARRVVRLFLSCHRFLKKKGKRKRGKRSINVMRSLACTSSGDA
jgi:hypothetical protein